MNEISLLNIVVDKQGKPTDYNIFEMAWKVLIQRFENTMANRNFSGPANPDERGIIFPDNTDNKKLTKLLRKMRHYNPITNQPHHGDGYRDLRIENVIEDPNFRSSEDSYYVQAADVAAFLIYQHFAPSSYMKKKSGQNYFTRLEPILCKVASSKDPRGIVHL